MTRTSTGRWLDLYGSCDDTEREVLRSFTRERKGLSSTESLDLAIDMFNAWKRDKLAESAPLLAKQTYDDAMRARDIYDDITREGKP